MIKNQPTVAEPLQTGHGMMASLLSSSEICVFFLDEQLQLENFTQGCERLFGLTTSDLGAPISRIVEQWGNGNWDTIARHVFKSGESIRKRLVIRGNGAPSHHLEIALEPRKSENGRTTGVIASAHDISEHVKREKALQATNEAKASILRNLSHDLRTPLTAIMGLAESVGVSEDKLCQDIGKEIEDSCDYLVSALDSILHFAHLDDGHIKLDLTPVSLDKVFDEIRHTFDPKCVQPDGISRLQIKKEDTPLYARAEHGALRRVLGNVVGNALKFCPEAPVTITAERDDGRIRIEVTDRGPGISEDFLPEAFKPFTRADRTKQTQLPGSGLGLSICDKLVRLMSGSIHLDSEPGQGTRVSIFLPLAEGFGDENLENAGTAPQKQQARALICDDHGPTRMVLRRMLKEYDVAVVSTEEEIYQQIDQFDVLVLDINLNGKHRGIDIMEQLRKEPKYRNLRIIAFTAHALPGHEEHFIEKGFDGYISKPFRRQELLEKISLALEDL